MRLSPPGVRAHILPDAVGWGRVVSITVCMSWAEVIDHREAELGAVSCP